MPDLVMLYDGDCAFCNGAVQWTLKRDRVGTLRFAPLAGGFARGVIDRHPRLAGLDTVVVVETAADGSERTLTHSDAVLRLVRYLGGWYRLAQAGAVVPKPLRDFAYKLFARNRYRLFGRADGCSVPSPAVRARFVA